MVIVIPGEKNMKGQNKCMKKYGLKLLQFAETHKFTESKISLEPKHD